MSIPLKKDAGRAVRSFAKDLLDLAAVQATETQADRRVLDLTDAAFAEAARIEHFDGEYAAPDSAWAIWQLAERAVAITGVDASHIRKAADSLKRFVLDCEPVMIDYKWRRFVR